MQDAQEVGRDIERAREERTKVWEQRKKKRVMVRGKKEKNNFMLLV